MALSYENTIATLIPDVYIARVTLETSGSPVKESNPHIVHERENTVGETLVQILEDAQAPQQLVVTVDLSLREKINNNLTSSWFGEQEFTKYLKIKLIQSTNPFHTNRLMYVSPQPLTGSSPVGVEEHIFSAALDGTGSSTDLTDHRSHVNSDGVLIYDINYRVKFYIPIETPGHLAYFAVSYIDMEQLTEDFDLKVNEENNVNGKVASDIVIRNGEVVSKAWVYKTVDGSTWAGPVHVQDGIWMSGSKPMNSSVPLKKHEVVNRKVQDFRNIKKIEKLQIDLTTFENTLMTQKNKLKLKTNDNTDVQRKSSYFTDIYLSRDSDGSARLSFGLDFRQYVKDNSIYGKLFDTSTIRNDILKSANIRTMKVYRRRVRNIQTLNRLGSPVGDGEVVWDRAETPVLLAVSGERNEDTEIKRVENDLGALKEVFYVMNDSADTEDMRFFTAIDKTIQDVTDGHYQYGVELEVEDGSFNYLTKLVQDLLIQRKYIYEYYERGSALGVTKKSVVIDDPHIEGFLSTSTPESLKPTFQAYDPLSNRFTKAFYLDETSDEKYKKWLGGFLVSTAEEPWIKPLFLYLKAFQLMTQSPMAAEAFASLLTITNPQVGSPKGVMTFIGLLDNLISKIQRVLAIDSGIRTVRTIDTAVAYPPKSTVEGKTSVKVFRDTKWFTNRSFDADIEKNVGFDYLLFDDQSDSSGLSVSTVNRDGLKEFDEGHYKSRVDLETKNYFNNLITDPNLTAAGYVYTSGDSLNATSFTFLSPSRCYLPGLSMDLSHVPDWYSDSEYSNAEAGILAYNWGYSPEVNVAANMTPAEAQNQANLKTFLNMNKFFAGLNTTLMPISGQEPIAQTDLLIQPSEPSDITLSDSGRGIDPIVDIVNIDPAVNRPVSGNSTNTVFSDLSQLFLRSLRGDVGNSSSCVFAPPSADYSLPKIGDYNLNSNDNVLTRSPERAISSMIKANGHKNIPPAEQTRSYALKTLPNQVKSLFLGNLNPSLVNHEYDTNFSLNTVARFRFNQQFIVRVDRLVGYEKSSGKRHVRQSIWEPLTRADFYSIGGPAILCRLQRYTCPEIGITWLPGLTLPISDEYFVLRPPASPGGAPAAEDHCLDYPMDPDCIGGGEDGEDPEVTHTTEPCEAGAPTAGTTAGDDTEGSGTEGGGTEGGGTSDLTDIAGSLEPAEDY